MNYLKYRFLIAVFMFAMIVVGCSDSQVEKPTITDDSTPLKPPIVELNDGLIAVKYHSDWMSRGNFEYLFSDYGETIIDPHYYNENDLALGDIIYYQFPDVELDERIKVNIDESSVYFARVVGLPKDRLKFTDGQIYLNEQMLDTFYGFVSEAGMNEEEYIAYRKQKDAEFHLRDEQEEKFRLNSKETVIPDDHVYVVVDNWMRGIDSRHFGTLPMDHILGKVLGVVEECSSCL